MDVCPCSPSDFDRLNTFLFRPGSRLIFCWRFYLFFSCREISELYQPIAAKFCIVIGSAFSFKISVKNFGRFSPQKKIRSQKHAKFGQISHDFKVRRRIGYLRVAFGVSGPQCCQDA